ncbi:MAG: hypothetical protein ABWJ42_03130 [Sulfolobales archaeon]
MRRRRELISMLNSFNSILTLLIEALRIGTNNLFVAYDKDVYIFLSNRPIERIPEKPPDTALLEIDGSIVLTLRSPVKRDFLQETHGVCEAIEYTLVELFDLAESVECLEREKDYIVKIDGYGISEPQRLLHSFGGLSGVIIGSIVSLAINKRVSVSAVEMGESARIIRVFQID